ncbi:MAG: hypothetical protein KAS23_16030 [Anaerohalosphaera sp.]|nr:hypothetical protein [Anaerohalosphaera sp.]
MASVNKNSDDRQRDQASIELLKRLRDKLLNADISTARKAAHNLSWKQEDGLAILKEALFGNYSRNAKKAAAYGLRSMNGRMVELAIEVLEQGLNHSDRTTKAACIKALQLMKGTAAKQEKSQYKQTSNKIKITEIPQKSSREASLRKQHPPKITK